MPSPSTAVTRAGRVGKVALGFGLVVAVLLGVLIFVRPTTVSTGPDQVALHYSDGAFTPRRFKDCVSSSTRAWDGPGSTRSTGCPISRAITPAIRSRRHARRCSP